MNRKIFNLILFLSAFLFLQIGGSSQENKRADSSPRELKGKVVVATSLEIDFSRHKITFIELGADRCIPCKEMQPIMKEIASEFADQVQVVFYDVWKDPAPARKYRIQLIPTQVFIDQKGQEISRHVGFFPKDEIVKLLKENGVK